MGLLLLLLRVGALESGYFEQMNSDKSIQKGQLKLIRSETKPHQIPALHQYRDSNLVYCGAFSDEFSRQLWTMARRA